MNTQPQHAIYRNGLIEPDFPLGLPDGTELNFVVLSTGRAPDTAKSSNDNSPHVPRVTLAEFDALMAKLKPLNGPSLPANFSREDIYNDHD